MTKKVEDTKGFCPTVKARLEDSDTEKWGISTCIGYSSVLVIILSYCVFLYDRNLFSSQVKHVPVLSSLEMFFDTIEKYSPFHEFLIDDSNLFEKSDKKENDKENFIPNESEKENAEDARFITPGELKAYDGSEGSPGLYIGLLGQVFDVSKGKDHYGPGGGYSFFAAKDGSRAFVTGEFNDAGLIDDVTGLDSESYLGLDDWLKFYHKDYTYVGKLAGRYYDAATGKPTKFYHMLQDAMEDAKAKKAEKAGHHKIFPPCNSEWSQNSGHRLWCTELSGGIKRNWVGVPRKLFMPGQTERCACVKDYGDSISGYDGGNKQKRGDLGHPNLKAYDGCDPKSDSCKLA